MKYQNSGHKAAATQQLNRQLNLLQQDICLPAAVLKQSAVEHNLQWMQRFANSCGVSLAPHGKTSMTPWLFQQQLASGAWGITVATAYQAQVAAQAGAQRETGRHARTVVLKLKTADFRILTRSLTPTVMPDTLEAFTALALELRQRVDLPARTRYRLVGVGLANFRGHDDAPPQPGLFDRDEDDDA